MANSADSARAFALVVADIFEASGRLRRSGESIAREHGQTQARWQVLSVVSEGEWTVPRIAERLGVTRQGVQRIADELVSHGLAAFRRNERHARSDFLVMTPAGAKTLAAITRSARKLNGRLARSLGERRVHDLHMALAHLLTELKRLR